MPVTKKVKPVITSGEASNLLAVLIQKITEEITIRSNQNPSIPIGDVWVTLDGEDYEISHVLKKKKGTFVFFSEANITKPLSADPFDPYVLISILETIEKSE